MKKNSLTTAVVAGIAGIAGLASVSPPAAYWRTPSRWNSSEGDPWHRARCRPLKKKPSKMYAKRRAKEVAARKKKAADRRR
jgi:hypothetical protein